MADLFAIVSSEYKTPFTVNVVIKTTWGKLRNSAFLSVVENTSSYIRWLPSFTLPIQEKLSGETHEIEYVHIRGSITTYSTVYSRNAHYDRNERTYALLNMQPFGYEEDGAGSGRVQLPADGVMVKACFLYRSTEETTRLATTIAVDPHVPLGYINILDSVLTIKYPDIQLAKSTLASIRRHGNHKDRKDSGSNTHLPPAPATRAASTSTSCGKVETGIQTRHKRLRDAETQAEETDEVAVQTEKEKEKEENTKKITATAAKILDIVTYDNSATATIALVSTYNSGTTAWPADTRLRVILPSSTAEVTSEQDHQVLPADRSPVQPGEGFTFSATLKLKSIIDIGKYGFYLFSPSHGTSGFYCQVVPLIVDFPDCAPIKKPSKQDAEALQKFIAAQMKQEVGRDSAFRTLQQEGRTNNKKAAAGILISQSLLDKLSFKVFQNAWLAAQENEKEGEEDDGSLTLSQKAAKRSRR